MKRKNLFLSLLFPIALLAALVNTHGIGKINPPSLPFPFYSANEILLDTLESRVARLQSQQNGTEIIPIRQGFPYCEPFTGNILERVNTKVGGSASLTAAPGQNNGVLQLTNLSSPGQLGYSFIDLPFSSTYGIKVSFEYFIYNNTSSGGVPNDPGDGISFFLFDGAITSNAFKIGGLGGSLGYAPHGYSNNNGILPFSGDPGTPPPPANLNSEGEQGFGGLKGGYLGIGFDVWGKFGNEFERRYGGFLRPNDYWATHYNPPSPIQIMQPRYPNSVVVRGPQIIAPNEYRRNGLPKDYTLSGKITPPFSSYNFVTGKVTYKDPISPGPDVDLGTGQLDPSYFITPQFKLSSQGRVDDCNMDGYRKVFIDFKPINPLNPAAGYLIKVDMLVNNGGGSPSLVPVLNTTFNPAQPVPPTFKLGFAGATGSKQAFQEIRNVTVQVSNENQLTKPSTNDLNASACLGEEEFFELDVNLQNINSQIQCIQLYQTEAEALEVQNQLNQITNVQDCNSGICQIEVCTQERLTETTSLGTFEAFLFLENGIEVPKVKFKSTAGVTGTTSIWYTVTDNFGQISTPKQIIITINPFPKIDGSATIIGPTCNGQNDGTISNVILKDLIPGYSFVWADQAGNILPSSNYTVTETPSGGYIQANVGVTGVNLGKYFLTVNNPATNSACDDVFEFEVKDVRGTPVQVVLNNQEVCEGTPVVFQPELEDPTDASNPKFLWWKDNGKTKPITNNLTEGTVTYQITAPGILSVSGLPQSATPYKFYVEVAADASQNLCATPAGNLKEVQVLVLPPLALNAVVVNDLCLDGIGQITVNATGGFGTYTYSLDGGAPQSSNVFSGLMPGTYSIDVTAGTNCIGTITKEVLGAPELFLTEVEVIQPACGVANGLIEVSFTGGTPAYTLQLLKNGSIAENIASATSPKVFQNLGPGTYQVKITNSNGCARVLDYQLINDVGIPITVDPMADEICEGDKASVIPVVNTTGNASLKWYKNAAGTDEIVCSATPDANGIKYTINSTSLELQVEGLKAGTYTYYLGATGPGYCPSPPFKAEVVVFPPITATIETTEEICFNASDGTLKITAAGADGNFEYSINGAPFVSNNLITGLAPGTYTIDIRSTGDNGCTYQTTASIAGPSSPISINTPDILRSSCNLSNGSIENLVISGGWGNYKVEWRKGSITGAIVAGDLTGAKDLAPDTYYLLVTDEKGCLASFPLEVTEQPQPVFQINQMEVCAGEPVLFTPINTVSGSSHTELQWYKDAGKTQPIQSGPDSQNPSISYAIDPDSGNLTITGLAGKSTPYSYFLFVECSDAVVEAKALVRIVPNPVFITEPVSCFGGNDGKILVQSGGDAKYLYSVDGGSPITESALEALTFSAKTYSIQVSNEGFCFEDFSVSVIQPTAALSVAPLTKIDPGCGANIGVIQTQITGGWGPYQVEVLKNGSRLQVLSVPGPDFELDGLAPGDYSVKITDSEGCQVASNTIQLVYGPTVIEANDTEICEGEIAVFTPEANPTPTGATFQWYKDSNLTQAISTTSTPDASGRTYQISSSGVLTVTGLKYTSSPASFFVTITGGNSCPGFKKEVKAIINRLPAISFNVKDEVCFGEKGSITLQGSAGDGTFSYSLDGSNFQSSNSFSVSPGTYTGYVKSGAGCIVSTANILVKGPSSALSVTEPIKEDATCNSQDGSITLDISGGYGSYTILVKRNGQNYSSTTFVGGTFNLTNLPSGTYSIEVTDAGGCKVLVPGQISVDNLPTPLEAEGDQICEGEIANLTPKSTQTGISPQFTWYRDANGSNQITSGTSNGITYQIGSDGALSIQGLKGQSVPYLYYVKVTGSGVCEPPLLPVEVMVYGIPNLRVSNPSIVCDPNGSVDLTEFIEGFNPTVYDYMIYSPSGNLMQVDDIDAVTQNGNYQVQSSIKGSNCWTPNQRIQVRIAEEELIPDFGYEADLGGGNFISNAEAQILEPVNFLDTSLGKVIIWNWDFGDGNSSGQQNPTHIYEKKGIYTVTLTTIDEIGCVAITQKTIEVLDDHVIIIPNAFTPDGSKNQYFKPQFRGVASMEFYIFSTWGELIFQSNSLETQGWDGKVNGSNAQNGNYVYKAIFKTRSGETVEKAGVFILIR